MERYLGKVRRDKGFTLIEVLIAVMIMGLSITAVMMTAGYISQNSRHIEEKSAAHWVAQSVWTQIQSGKQSSGVSRGNISMMGQSWYWEANTQLISEMGVYRVDITVRKTADGGIASQLQSYLPVGRIS